MFAKRPITTGATTMIEREDTSRVRMRSPRGLLAAIFFLLAVPVTFLFQILLGSGASTAIHLALGAGSVVLAFAVFDFKLPRWMNWIGCAAALAVGSIFLLQAVALVIPNESLHYFAYEVLGQWPEGWLPDVVLLWFVGMLVFDSQGKTRILGFVTLSIIVCFEIYKYSLAYLGNTPAEGLKLLFLLPIVWFLLESKKEISVEAKPVILASSLGEAE